MNLIVSSIGQGLLWALLGLGLYLTFRILDFADMTVEGTFPLGAASSVAAITHGFSPLTATLIAIGAGMLAGLITGLLYTKGKIPSLLAGILTFSQSASEGPPSRSHRPSCSLTALSKSALCQSMVSISMPVNTQSTG